jgi:hypothetical protein
MVARRTGSWRTSIAPAPRERALQLRLPTAEWQRYLADPEMIAAYHQRVCRVGEHWFWTGALSGSGHGRLRVPRHLGSRVVASHLYGFQLVYGALRLTQAGLPLIRHRCDNASCHRPSCWVTGDAAANAADYQARSGDALSPLADKRGAGGRARAIRAAILQARARGTDVDRAIRHAIEAGMPGVQDALSYGG